jgi:diadenosine tetraphosphate (Ap4A) HIT family hydrolase
MPKDRAVGETELAYAIRDAFLVTSLHTLVIPKRHVRGYFELGRSELNACQRLLEQEKKAIEQADPSVEGFNVGVNEGEVAGQTIFHYHVHLVPRRKGDVEDPTGGVRHVLPGKGDYRR